MNFQEAFAQFLKENPTEPLTQLVFLTFANGQQVMALAPVVHDPESNITCPELQSIEFADIVPRTTAMKLLSGEFKPDWIPEQ